MTGERRPGPGVADNRGVKILVDKGALLCGCVLLTLLAGRTDALVVIWLLAAATVAGLSVVADQQRWIIAAPVVYLLLGAFTTASVAGAPLAVYAWPASPHSGPGGSGPSRRSAARRSSWPWPGGRRKSRCSTSSSSARSRPC